MERLKAVCVYCGSGRGDAPQFMEAARAMGRIMALNEVTLIYTYDLSSAQQQTFRLEYAPERRWTFVLTRDQNGLVGSDVLYKTRLP